MDEYQEKRCTISNSNPFWLHYLSLEKSLLEISEYIAITKDNYQCYSFKNMQLFYAVCSEIDSIFKHIRRNLGLEVTGKGNINIEDNITMLDDSFPVVRDTLVVTNINGCTLEIQPFKRLFADYIDKAKVQKKEKSWWQQYNAVKHQRLNNFDKANLKNILESLSALHILNLTYALSLESDLMEDYENVLIQVSVRRQYPIFELKNSDARSYAGGGSDYYAGFLTNKKVF